MLPRSCRTKQCGLPDNHGELIMPKPKPPFDAFDALDAGESDAQPAITGFNPGTHDSCNSDKQVSAAFQARLASLRQEMHSVANFVVHITPLEVADIVQSATSAANRAFQLPAGHRYYLSQTVLADQVGQWYPVANVFNTFEIDIVQQQVGRLAGPGGLTLLNSVFHCTPDRAEQLNQFFHELRNPGLQAPYLSEQKPIVLRQQRDRMLTFSVVVTAKDKIGFTTDLARVCSKNHFNVVSVTSWSYRPKIRHGENVTISDEVFCTFQLNIEAAPGTTEEAVQAAFRTLTKTVSTKANNVKEKVLANRVPNHYLALRDEVLLLSPFTDLDLLARNNH